MALLEPKERAVHTAGRSCVEPSLSGPRTKYTTSLCASSPSMLQRGCSSSSEAGLCDGEDSLSIAVPNSNIPLNLFRLTVEVEW
jgi:hypothetical protein